MLTKCPALIPPLARDTQDLLNKHYSTDQKINITTYSETGLFQALNSGLAKKGGLSSGDAAAQYRYNNATLDV